jgi:predicted RNA-binding protein YlxR (DUF448 family)
LHLRQHVLDANTLLVGVASGIVGGIGGAFSGIAAYARARGQNRNEAGTITVEALQKLEARNEYLAGRIDHLQENQIKGAEQRARQEMQIEHLADQVTVLVEENRRKNETILLLQTKVGNCEETSRKQDETIRTLKEALGGQKAMQEQLGQIDATVQAAIHRSPEARTRCDDTEDA